MKMNLRALVWPTIGVLLTACNASMPTKSPSQTSNKKSSSKASTMQIAKAAVDFEDSDIAVPAFFDVQGLQFCNYTRNETDDRCPLKKPIVRLYFGDHQTKASGAKGIGLNALQQVSEKDLILTLENQLAGLNRYRIVTRDNDVVDAETAEYCKDQGKRACLNRYAEMNILKPDYVLKLDTLKTVDMFYGATSGFMDYALELTVGTIDPLTKEKISHPNIGKIRVKSQQVSSKKELETVMVSGRYYSGFNFDDKAAVTAHVQDMASRSFDILLTRMLSELPATAQVKGIKGNQISLDRGQNAGVLPNETMVVFQYDAGFIEPIGVANVNPSKSMAAGEIVRWKKSDLADTIRKQSADGIYRPANGSQIFAVSVGTPANFLQTRT